MMQLFVEGVPNPSLQTGGTGAGGVAISGAGQDIPYDPNWDSIWDPNNSLVGESSGTSQPTPGSSDAAGGLQSITIDIPVNREDWAFTDQFAIVATLTGSNGTKSVFAHEFQIKAQTSTNMGSVKHWRDLVNGTQNCTNCQSLSISVLPADTKRIRISMSFVGEILVASAIYLVSMHAIPAICDACRG